MFNITLICKHTVSKCHPEMIYKIKSTILKKKHNSNWSWPSPDCFFDVLFERKSLRKSLRIQFKIIFKHKISSLYLSSVITLYHFAVIIICMFCLCFMNLEKTKAHFGFLTFLSFHYLFFLSSQTPTTIKMTIAKQKQKIRKTIPQNEFSESMICVGVLVAIVEFCNRPVTNTLDLVL